MSSTLHTFAKVLAAPPPWFDPYLSIAQRIETTQPSVADALSAANSQREAPVSFVDQARLPADDAYEAFIRRTSCVPTRDNLHDLLNGLVWLRFPLTKRRLNVLQAEQIAARGIAGSRGPLRDALTVFDENGAMLRAPELLIEALRCRDWKTVFVERRDLWQSAELMLFGHALLEKLMQPRKAITAHVWVLDSLDDDALAASLTVERLVSKVFLPLPVLGVPGWWSPNDDPRFYDDSAVFRVPR